jgi:formylglycine-generating enzyme required for sulfatase activity
MKGLPMYSVVRISHVVQASCFGFAAVLAGILLTAPVSRAISAEPAAKPVLPVADSEAKTEAEMKPYSDLITGPDVKFDMVPIKGGSFAMGSPATEAERKEDEGPQHEVKIEPFWMGAREVTWDEYDVWTFALDIQRRELKSEKPNEMDQLADAVARPTKPYSDMTFGMGKGGYPAICMTQLAAKVYCKWLTAKTGRYYRIPTEAEWEYACRAGSKTAYHFGDDPEKLGEYAWYFDNCNEKYHKVGTKKPNPWGLYDMHGNVSEWVQDQLLPDFYGKCNGNLLTNPVAVPTSEYPRCVRGGSWDDDPPGLRSSARKGSTKDWKMQDPQFPQSIWYFTDAQFVGFRVVRPLRAPTAAEEAAYWADGSKDGIERLKNYQRGLEKQ